MVGWTLSPRFLLSTVPPWPPFNLLGMAHAHRRGLGIVDVSGGFDAGQLWARCPSHSNVRTARPRPASSGSSFRFVAVCLANESGLPLLTAMFAVVTLGIRRAVLPKRRAAAAVHPEAIRAAPLWAGPAARIRADIGEGLRSSGSSR